MTLSHGTRRRNWKSCFLRSLFGVQISFINTVFSGKMTPEEQAEKALGSNENLRANDSGLSLNIDNFISGIIRCEFPAVVRSPVLGSVVNIFSSNRFNITGIGEFKLSAGFMKNVSGHIPPFFERECRSVEC